MRQGDHQTDSLSSSSDANELALYVIKKIEKISKAIYLLTNYLPIEEPFRRRIRDRALHLIEELYTLQINTSPDIPKLVALCQNSLSELQSMMSIGVSAGLMSEMNYDILSKEMSDLQTLTRERLLPKVPQLSNDFFISQPDQTEPAITLNRHHQVLSDSNRRASAYSRINKFSSLDEDASKSANKEQGKKPIRRRHGRNHTKRQRAILELFNDSNEITINDVQTVVEGCSQKTMQRELKTMVNEGLIEKHGKRRWSSYQLADGINLNDELKT